MYYNKIKIKINSQRYGRAVLQFPTPRALKRMDCSSTLISLRRADKVVGMVGAVIMCESNPICVFARAASIQDQPTALGDMEKMN